MKSTPQILDHYRFKNVAAVKTPKGVIIMGARKLPKQERDMLMQIPQTELIAALRWQR